MSVRRISFATVSLCGVLAGGLALPPQAVASASGSARVVVADGQRAARDAPFRMVTRPTIGRPLAALSAGSRPYGTLTGVIIGADGRPLARACVSATGASGGTMTLSRASGRYVIARLRPGRYTLRYADCSSPGKYLDQISSADVASPERPASPMVVSGQVKDLPTITLRLADPAAPPTVARPGRVRGTAPERSGTGQIRGTVLGAGRPVGGICVQGFPARGGSTLNTTTSASGRYVMSRVPAGRYQVEFACAVGCHNPGNWLSQWYRGVTSPFPNRGVVVRVASGKVTRGIDASLRRGAQISGLVTSRAGKPLRGICVAVQGRVAGGFTEATPGTGKHGRYVVHGVFKGRYIVSFSIGCGNSGNFAPQWWRHAATQRAATPIPVAGTRKLASVDAVLDPGSAIAGVVRASGPAGPPLRGICVDANSRTGISAHTRTGKTGRYTLSGLAAGRTQSSTRQTAATAAITCRSCGRWPFGLAGRGGMSTSSSSEAPR